MAKKYRIPSPVPRGQLRVAEIRYRKFGGTLEMYDRLFQEQGGVCAICNKECKTGKRLCFDHNSRTNTPRGLLCYSCNTKLGFVEKWLPQIVAYLRRYRTRP